MEYFYKNIWKIFMKVKKIHTDSEKSINLKYKKG